jgi:hypothetical protein
MKPFDKEKAAQYFIVAWVKNWSIYTYIGAIGVKDMDYGKIYDLYPWMPDEKNKHYYFKTEIRPWCALAMSEINNKLWDINDNAKRLALAKRIENWDSSGVKPTTRHIKDTQEHKKDMRETRQSGLAHKVSMETMRRGGGHHWNVVK